MYKQKTHIVYGELHILSYLVLDQKSNDNAYSAPLRHEVWNVYHKRVMLGIDCVTIHFQIFELHSSIILNMILYFCPFSFHESFFNFPWSMAPLWRSYSSIWSLNYWAKLKSLFSVPVCILTCESNLTDPGSWTLDINWYIYNAYQQNWVHQPLLSHIQVHLHPDQLW